MADPEKTSEQKTPELSPRTRKLLLWIGLGIALFFFLLQLVPPILRYMHSPFAGLSADLAHGAEIGLPALFLIAGILIQMGVLPSAPRGPDSQKSSVYRLRNLALWIVIALLMVFLFNLFQGTGPSGHQPVQHAGQQGAPHDSLIGLLINWFPMLLIAGVWLFFMSRFQAKKNKDLGKS